MTPHAFVLPCARYIAAHTDGTPRTAAELRREWRRARPQGMKIQRGTSRSSRKLTALFYAVRGTIRGSLKEALRRARGG